MHTHTGRLAKARFLGADAGASVLGADILTDDQARAIIEEAAEEDHVRRPNLSGEWADDMTPESLARELGQDPEDQDKVNELADAWEEGVSLTYTYAAGAMAYRTLGMVTNALPREQRIDQAIGQLGYRVEVLEAAENAVMRGVHALDSHGERPMGTHPERYDIHVNWRELVRTDGRGALGETDMENEILCALARIMAASNQGMADDETYEDYGDNSPTPYSAGLELLGIASDDAWQYGFDANRLGATSYEVLAQVWNDVFGFDVTRIDY